MTLIFILVLLLNKWYRSRKFGLDSQWSLIVTSKNFIQKHPFMSFWHGLQWFRSMWDVQILRENHQTTLEDKYNKKTCSQLQNWPITNSMEQSIYWKDNRSSATQEILTFYEIPMFITLTQNPTTLPVLSQTRPVHAPHPISRGSILISCSHLCLDFPCCFFPSSSPPKPFARLSCLPYIPHAKPTSFLIGFINRIT